MTELDVQWMLSEKFNAMLWRYQVVLYPKSALPYFWVLLASCVVQTVILHRAHLYLLCASAKSPYFDQNLCLKLAIWPQGRHYLRNHNLESWIWQSPDGDDWPLFEATVVTYWWQNWMIVDLHNSTLVNRMSMTTNGKRYMALFSLWFAQEYIGL